MKQMQSLKKQRGISLMAVIFIIVLLTLLAITMLSTLGVQSSTAVLGIQGARAYQAANTGIEWGIAELTTNGFNVCDAPPPVSFPNTINHSVGALNNFRSVITCTELGNGHTEGGTTHRVFQIVSTGLFSNYGTEDFISRRIAATIVCEPGVDC